MDTDAIFKKVFGENLQTASLRIVGILLGVSVVGSLVVFVLHALFG
jgi:hypothetical protein